MDEMSGRVSQGVEVDRSGLRVVSDSSLYALSQYTHLSPTERPERIPFYCHTIHRFPPLRYCTPIHPLHLVGPPASAHAGLVDTFAQTDRGPLLSRHELTAVDTGPEVVGADIAILTSCQKIGRARRGGD